MESQNVGCRYANTVLHAIRTVFPDPEVNYKYVNMNNSSCFGNTVPNTLLPSLCFPEHLSEPVQKDVSMFRGEDQGRPQSDWKLATPPSLHTWNTEHSQMQLKFQLTSCVINFYIVTRLQKYVYTLVTNCNEQSPSSEADSSSAGQEILYVLWNPKGHAVA
jgi:hypothetical protein